MRIDDEVCGSARPPRQDPGDAPGVGLSAADAPPAPDLVALPIRADLDLRQLAQRTTVPDPEAALAGRARDRRSRVDSRPSQTPWTSGGVAPIPAVRGATIEPLKSTLRGRSPAQPVAQKPTFRRELVTRPLSNRRPPRLWQQRPALGGGGCRSAAAAGVRWRARSTSSA